MLEGSMGNDWYTVTYDPETRQTTVTTAKIRKKMRMSWG